MAGSLREMNKPGTKCFKVTEMDETKCIQWDDEMSERMHTCMLEESVASANEEPFKQEGVTFMDEQVMRKFGIDNCATGLVCKDKRLVKELREPPPGVDGIGI
eukprot:4066482-Ditylum_brightwellii.AAC.1